MKDNSGAPMAPTAVACCFELNVVADDVSSFTSSTLRRPEESHVAEFSDIFLVRMVS